MKVKFACCAALAIGLLVSPAFASVVVSFNPTTSNVHQGDVFWVDIVANIPANEPIVGWGFDLNIANPLIADRTATPVTIGPLWTPAFSADSDPYSALAFSSGVTGASVLLAQVEFHAIAASGSTALTISTTPGDLTEGFALMPPPTGQFAQVTYLPGAIVIPEPASLLLLGLTALLRRR